MLAKCRQLFAFCCQCLPMVFGHFAFLCISSAFAFANAFLVISWCLQLKKSQKCIGKSKNTKKQNAENPLATQTTKSSKKPLCLRQRCLCSRQNDNHCFSVIAYANAFVEGTIFVHSVRKVHPEILQRGKAWQRRHKHTCKEHRILHSVDIQWATVFAFQNSVQG